MHRTMKLDTLRFHRWDCDCSSHLEIHLLPKRFLLYRERVNKAVVSSGTRNSPFALNQKSSAFNKSPLAFATLTVLQWKRTYLQTEEECRQQGVQFVPLVAETSGGWGASAFATFRRMAKLVSSKPFFRSCLNAFRSPFRAAKARRPSSGRHGCLN